MDGAFAALDANMRCIRSLPSIFALPPRGPQFCVIASALHLSSLLKQAEIGKGGRKDRQIAKPKGLCETKKEVVALSGFVIVRKKDTRNI